MNVTTIDAPDAPGSAIVTLISSGVNGIPAVVPDPPDPTPATPLQAKICAPAALVDKTAPSTYALGSPAVPTSVIFPPVVVAAVFLTTQNVGMKFAGKPIAASSPVVFPFVIDTVA